MGRDDRVNMLRDGRSAFAQKPRHGKTSQASQGGQQRQGAAVGDDLEEDQSGLAVAAPPGAAPVKYDSLAGN